MMRALISHLVTLLFGGSFASGQEQSVSKPGSAKTIGTDEKFLRLALTFADVAIGEPTKQ